MNMTFPVELGLKTYHGDVRLSYKPVMEIKKIFDKCILDGVGIDLEDCAEINSVLSNMASKGLYHIRLAVKNCESFELYVSGRKVDFNVTNQMVTICGNSFRGLDIFKGRGFDVELIIDVNTIELFSTSFLDYWPQRLEPGNDTGVIKITGEKGTIERLTVHSLESCWK